MWAWPCCILLILASFGVAARAIPPRRSHSLTPIVATSSDVALRTFMQTVAHDVTQEGPLAWLKFFDSGSEFFMAVNGQLVFPNAAAAEQGTRAFAQTMQHIELTWGELRIDPLTTQLAMVGSPWREVQVDKSGHRVEETGYFTGLVEYRDDRWRFRDAHWSAPVAQPVH